MNPQILCTFTQTGNKLNEQKAGPKRAMTIMPKKRKTIQDEELDLW